MKNSIILVLAFGLLSITSCNKKNLFEQPSIEVTGVSLKKLPQDSTHLIIDLKIKNNDTREADILDASYQATIENTVSGTEHVQLNKTIQTDTPLVVSLPLTLLTDDAIELLKKLNKGESLNYLVTGTFHVNQKHLKNFDLPINITGTTSVKVGYDNFFTQPKVTVDSIHGSYSIVGSPIPSSYKFNLLVSCTVKNMDKNNAVIDTVVYTPTIEGNQAAKETYTKTITIAAGDSVNLVLPVYLELNATQGAQFVIALTDGYANYIVKGTFHTSKVNQTAANFKLPLYEKGKVPITSFVQTK